MSEEAITSTRNALNRQRGHYERVSLAAAGVAASVNEDPAGKATPVFEKTLNDNLTKLDDQFGKVEAKFDAYATAMGDAPKEATKKMDDIVANYNEVRLALVEAVSSIQAAQAEAKRAARAARRRESDDDDEGPVHLPKIQTVLRPNFLDESF